MTYCLVKNMLNPELQKNIDMEINKSSAFISEFLHGEYFQNTMGMVGRVNRLDEMQLESLELETILNILKLSEYENFYDAVLNEVFAENINASDEEKLKINTQTRQVSSDIENYVFLKLKEEEGVSKEVVKEADEQSKEVGFVKKDQFDNLDAILKGSTKNLREEMGERVDNQNAFNLLKTNNFIKKINPEKVVVSVPVSVPNITTLPDSVDFYKEKVDDVDKVIKKEMEAVYNKDN